LQLKYDIKILGITISFGNTTLQNGINNTQIVMNALNWDVPIYGGSGHSILQKFYTDNYFGEDGISGFQSSLLDTELKNLN